MGEASMNRTKFTNNNFLTDEEMKLGRIESLENIDKNLQKL
jgi:hypothetical protein